MIAIDPRAGSKDLILPLLEAGVPAEERQLTAGDVEILGNGPQGPLIILVEYKKIGDVIQCMRNGRFADQLRAMRQAGNISMLLIEGTFSVGESGVLGDRRYGRFIEWPGRVTAQELESWLFSMIFCGGVLTATTANEEQSVRFIRNLWLWWTAKEWSGHRAHLEWYTPPDDGVQLVEPSVVQKWAKALPGVGALRAAEVAKRFKTPLELAEAGAEEWVGIEGIGKKTAAKVVKAIRG